MAEKIKSMTRGKPLKLIVAFALPLMVGNVFQQLYTVVDTMVVGQVLGVSALAALGASDWLNWMVLGMVSGFAQGFSIKMAQEFGAGRMEELKKTTAMSVCLGCLLGILLLVLSQVFVRPVLLLMNTPADIIENTLLYLRILFSGIPFLMLYNLTASMLRALGDGKNPLYAMVVSSVVNVALDVIFVVFWGWGIAGAALATVIAESCSGLYCILVIRKIESLKLEKRHWQPEGLILSRLMRLGIPVAFQSMVISVGGLVVQYVVNGFGVVFIAGFTATNKLYGVLEMAATAYGYAMTTYVGQNLGAGNVKRIREGMRAAVLVAVLTSLVISACMILFGRTIVGWFISGDPAEAREAITVAYHFLLVMSSVLFILYLLFVYRSALQGMGDTVIPMVSGIAEFIMRISAALALPRFFGPEGVFFAEILAWFGATVILVTAYYMRMHTLVRRDNKIGG